MSEDGRLKCQWCQARDGAQVYRWKYSRLQWAEKTHPWHDQIREPTYRLFPQGRLVKKLPVDYGPVEHIKITHQDGAVGMPEGNYCRSCADRLLPFSQQLIMKREMPASIQLDNKGKPRKRKAAYYQKVRRSARGR